MGDADSSEGNIKRLGADRRRLGCKQGLLDVTFEFDDRYLNVTRKLVGNVKLRKYDLWLLHPAFSTQNPQSQHFGRLLRRGAVLVCAAVIVYFSSYHVNIPLLAPALLLLGVGHCIVSFMPRGAGPCTHIHGSGGEAVLMIPHVGTKGDERQDFEVALSKAIEEARQRVYFDRQI